MNLQLSFTDQSQSFAHGVEFGRLLEKIEQGQEVVKNNGFPIRVENCSIVAMACSLHGYIAMFGTEHPGGWVDFVGIKKTTSKN